MKTEILEALAIELTKAKINDLNPLDFKKTSAEQWIKTYQQSLAELKAECDKGRVRHKPATGGSTIF